MNLVKIYIFCSILIALIVVVYRDLPATFFQQDEWLAFGNLIYSQALGGFGKVIRDSIVVNPSAHQVPLTQISLFTQLRLFGLNFVPYALVSIAGQIITTLSFFYLVFLLTKNKTIAFFSALLFGLSSVSSQSVSWIAASIGTQGAVFSFLWCLILLFKYVSTDEKKKSYLYFSVFFVLTGLLFKETILPVFLLFPLFWFLFTKKRNKKSFFKILLPIIFIGFLYALMRLSTLFISQPITSSPSINSDKPWVAPHVSTYIFRVVTFPLKMISQTLIPPEQMTEISKKIVYLAYPQYFAFSEHETNPYVVETVLFDMVSYFFCAVILILSYIAYRRLRIKNPPFSKLLIFGYALIASSSLLYIILPGVSGFLSIFEPRYLYFGTVGMSFVATITLYGFVDVIFKVKKVGHYVFFISLLLMLTLYYRDTQKHIEFLTQLAGTRKSVLSQISSTYPVLPKKVILYSQSDNSYFGLVNGEKILPFQSGAGQMFLVWYKMHGENIPACFFTDNFLYAIESQGYKECEGWGFGYFRDLGLLKQAISTYKLSEDSIRSFSYTYATGAIQDTTPQIKRQLRDTNTFR